MRCARYVNAGGLEVRANDEPLEGVDCFKYLGVWVSTCAEH